MNATDLANFFHFYKYIAALPFLGLALLCAIAAVRMRSLK